MATITFISKLKEDGSLTIPIEVLEELGLHPGDEVQVRLEASNRVEDFEALEQAALQAKFERFFEELDILTFETLAMSDQDTVPTVSSEDQSAREALPPLLGQFHSGKGNLSQNTGEQFVEIVAEKHRNQRLQG